METILLKKIESREVIPGFKAKFVQSDNITLAYWEIKKGSILPEHKHPNEQISTVIKGNFKMKVEGKTKILHSGSVVVVPPSSMHSGEALTDCFIIDAYYPFKFIDL